MFRLHVRLMPCGWSQDMVVSPHVGVGNKTQRYLLSHLSSLDTIYSEVYQ